MITTAVTVTVCVLAVAWTDPALAVPLAVGLVIAGVLAPAIAARQVDRQETATGAARSALRDAVVETVDGIEELSGGGGRPGVPQQRSRTLAALEARAAREAGLAAATAHLGWGAAAAGVAVLLARGGLSTEWSTVVLLSVIVLGEAVVGLPEAAIAGRRAAAAEHRVSALTAGHTPINMNVNMTVKPVNATSPDVDKGRQPVNMSGQLINMTGHLMSTSNEDVDMDDGAVNANLNMDNGEVKTDFNMGDGAIKTALTMDDGAIKTALTMDDGTVAADFNERDGAGHTDVDLFGVDGRISVARPRSAAEASGSSAMRAIDAVVAGGRGEVRVEGLVAGWDPRREPILDGLDLHLPAGSRTVITGRSGSGKSTLAAVLAGLLPPRDGAVIVKEPYNGPHTATGNGTRSTTGNGIITGGPAGDRTTTATGGGRIVLVGDETGHVFASTLRENLRLGDRDAGDEHLDAVLRRVGLGEWLAGLPAGLDTWLGTSGSTVSGGQRRRLATARALLADPALLILDEPTEGIDEDGAHRLMADLLGAADGRTVLVFAHRVEGFGLADRRLSLSRGKLTDMTP
ncbi:ATP-binding cassette domain-containing protein [Actinoplanes sp. NEAU-H7]|uniref:ATP-binding cassette domain-containing protein n=2 Tax=Actinoplanes flavus TaxID=2820290 RepID=A0ABS3US59_9ACTN|nr:ATP-binding cassette domain-containing protein [Actinoplanes flavus]